MPRSLLIAYIVAVLPLVIRVNASKYNKPVCRQRSAQPSLVGQRCITDTEVYINKTGVQDQHHCMLLCMRHPTCQVINFNIAFRYCELGQGHCVTLEREDYFVTTHMSRNPCLKWVSNLDNDVYKNISFQRNIGSPVFLEVVRARTGQNKIPGKSPSSHRYMYYTWEGGEKALPKSECEYLTLSSECTISWVPHDSTSGSPLPTGAVIGGVLNDTPLYVARKTAVHLPGTPLHYSIGYYNNVDGLGHVPFGGKDVIYNEVELLLVRR